MCCNDRIFYRSLFIQIRCVLKKRFDHLVGELSERGRHAEAQGFSGVEIDGEFEFGRELHCRCAVLAWN
jgi:hypothetical protein